MCEYERDVLSRIVFNHPPRVYGAAWLQARSALTKLGYLKDGIPTSAGRAALVTQGGG